MGNWNQISKYVKFDKRNTKNLDKKAEKIEVNYDDSAQKINNPKDSQINKENSYWV